MDFSLFRSFLHQPVLVLFFLLNHDCDDNTHECNSGTSGYYHIVEQTLNIRHVWLEGIEVREWELERRGTKITLIVSWTWDFRRDGERDLFCILDDVCAVCIVSLACRVSRDPSSLFVPLVYLVPAALQGRASGGSGELVRRHETTASPWPERAQR
jgi:hypothetical protein